jgi:hypothetical protein
MNSCLQNRLTREEKRFNKEYIAILQLENEAQRAEDTWRNLDTGYSTTTEQFSVDYHMIRLMHSQLEQKKISMEQSASAENIHKKGKKELRSFVFWLIETATILGAINYTRKRNDKNDYMNVA